MLPRKKRKGIIKVDWSLAFGVLVVPQHPMNSTVCKTFIWHSCFTGEITKLEFRMGKTLQRLWRLQWPERLLRVRQQQEQERHSATGIFRWSRAVSRDLGSIQRHFLYLCLHTPQQGWQGSKAAAPGEVGDSICQIILGLLQEDEGLMGRVKFHEMS